MKLSFRFLTLIFLNHVEKIDSKIYSNHGTENEVKNSYPQIPRRILSPRSLSLCFSVSKKKKNLLRSTFHDATMQYPVTVVRIFLLAAICMTQRRISRTPSVTLLVRRRKRGWTRGRRWVTRAQWVDTCVPCLPQQSAKTPVNNASIRYIGHCACTTLVFWPQPMPFSSYFSTVLC